MSDNDKETFHEYLKEKDVISSKPFSDFKSIVIKNKPAFLPDRPTCAYCGSLHVIKHGHKGGSQRYLCKDCGRTFTITNTPTLIPYRAYQK